MNIGIQFERTDDDTVTMFVELIVYNFKDPLPPERLHNLLLECEEYRDTFVGAPLLGWGEKTKKNWILRSYKVFKLSLAWYNANLSRIQRELDATPKLYGYIRPLGYRVRHLVSYDIAPSVDDFAQFDRDLSSSQKYCAAQIVKAVEKGFPVLVDVRPSLERNEAVLEALRVLGRPAIIVAEDLCVGQWMSQIISYYNRDKISRSRRSSPSSVQKSVVEARNATETGVQVKSGGQSTTSLRSKPKKGARTIPVPLCLKSVAEKGEFPYGAFGYRQVARGKFDALKYATTDDDWILPLTYSDLREGQALLGEFVNQLTSGFSPLARRKYIFVLTAKELSAMATRGLVRCPGMTIVYDQPIESWSDPRSKASVESARVAFGASKPAVVLSYSPLPRIASRNARLHELLSPPGEELELRRYSGSGLTFPFRKTPLDAPDPNYDEQSEKKGKGATGRASKRLSLPLYEDEYKWVLRRQAIRMDNGKLGMRGDWVERYVVRFPGANAEGTASEVVGGAMLSSGDPRAVHLEERDASAPREGNPLVRDRGSFLAAVYDFILQYVRKAGHSVGVACCDKLASQILSDIAPGRTIEVSTVKASAEATSFFAAKAEAYGSGESVYVNARWGSTSGGPESAEPPLLVLLNLRGIPVELNLGWIGTMFVVPEGLTADNSAELLAAQAVICHGLRSHQEREIVGSDCQGETGKEQMEVDGIDHPESHQKRRLIIFSQEAEGVSSFSPRSDPQTFPMYDLHTLEGIQICTASECLLACFGKD